MTITRFPIAALVAFIVLSSTHTSSHASDLIGAWATDASVCKSVFIKRGDKISFSDGSDMYGSGMIIQDDHIVGKMVTCKINSRKNDGEVTHFMLACSTDVALSTVQFSLKTNSTNTITRLYPGMSELETRYFRCTL